MSGIKKKKIKNHQIHQVELGDKIFQELFRTQTTMTRCLEGERLTDTSITFWHLQKAS